MTDPMPIEVRRHPRATRARLSVDPARGTVRLTLPPRAALKPALAWARDQAGWLAEQRERLPVALPFAPGATVTVDGEALTIVWQSELPRRVERIGSALRCGGPIDGLPRRIERWLKAEALAILTADTVALASAAGLTIEGVSVGDPARRWASCSSRGAIRYSWRLILAPPFVRLSTVAHELAHRLHMDHSPAFHAAAARIDPGDPAASRAWLRRHGAQLHWIGREN